MTSPLWEGVREGCGSCKFCFDGQCRRYPPTVVVMQVPDGWGGTRHDVELHRPYMDEHEWCGEYRRKIS